VHPRVRHCRWIISSACAIVLTFALTSRAQLPGEMQRQQTLKYLYALQQPDGSFGTSVQAPKSDLPTTSAAVRAIMYFGGEVPKADLCRRYLHGCQNEDGGFAANPGGMADVRSTALAVLALVELRDPDMPRLHRALRYLENHARSFEEIRIAAAAFEALQAAPNEKVLQAWQQEILRLRNDDGTFGKGDDVARDTGSAVACLLRLGLPVEKADVVTQAILRGQRPDGGWGRDQQPADLETTYRVLRALYMLKQKPNLDACAHFVARCRCENGGYALRPGESASPQATYFAAAILRWVRHWR